MVRLGQPKSKTEFSVFFFGFFFLAFHALAAEDPASQPSKPLGCDPERVLHGPGADTFLSLVKIKMIWSVIFPTLDFPPPPGMCLSGFCPVKQHAAC